MTIRAEASAARRGRRGRTRGGPLAMLAGVLALWVAGRAALWESPLGAPSEGLAPELIAASVPQETIAPSVDRTEAPLEPQPPGANPMEIAPAPFGIGRARLLPAAAGAAHAAPYRTHAPFAVGGPDLSRSTGHQRLLAAAMRATFRPARYADGSAGYTLRAEGQAPPFAPPTDRAGAARASGRPDRWSVDGWAFWRQGSDAAPISQGRVPIYGASQVGANLQWRARPSSLHDPRLHARAYRALVARGESELALGASARPLPRVPVRLVGEMRATDGAFSTELRPSAFAVTEFAPLRLPYAVALEAYAQGGYVGGEAATAFADGQVALTREIVAVDAARLGRPRLSIGGGAWGGAQEGAHRVDVGPTVRLDMTLGEVPARVSVDWREQVAGDAAPASGVAATLSTRF